MMRAVFLILALLFAPPATAAGSAVVARDWAYLETVDAYMAEKDARALDWAALRRLYLETSFRYAADGAAARERLAAAAEKLGGENGTTATAAYRALVRRHAALYTAHMSALAAAGRPGGGFIDAAWHAAALEGILDAIADEGDGASPETAFRVIDASEEDFMLRHRLKAEPGARRTVMHRGHAYDVVTCTNADGTAREVYFNVDEIMGVK